LAEQAPGLSAVAAFQDAFGQAAREEGRIGEAAAGVVAAAGVEDVAVQRADSERSDL
jgi:hypothetical protein